MTFDFRNVMKKTAVCEDLEFEKTVHFNVTMNVNSEICKNSQNGRVKKEVLIGAVGLEEKLTIDLEVICDCGCAKEENWVRS